MNLLYKIWNKSLPFLKNKFIITILLYLVFIIFISENNLLIRYQNIRHLSELEEQKGFYKQEIKNNNRRLHELKTDGKNLEKFAREEYLMKKDSETVFVIVKEEQVKP